ncbi:6261_t:CDS:2 [Diversispora eburnea]|uniref:6261_t:CDS:1 n=1 Tax=Diversispora eburnea TaxID=1213867 RepID=A0A9N9GIQ9_9GLOM|nr:6261_t:CDS:2 [Diversispora eburnea]
MGDKPFERPRRTGVNYTRTLNINLLSNKNKFKFNPIDKKEKFLNKKLDAENTTVNFGEITRISLRVNNIWQSAVIIFKEKSNAQKLLTNWSIIIGEDSLRITQLDQTIDNLKLRGQYAARVISLSNSITARELWPHIEKLEAKTCYFSRTRNYRKKGKAIISFQEEEACENACNAIWEGGDLNIRIVNIQTKKCYRCHKMDHFVTNCPRRTQDHKYKNKAAERIKKFETSCKENNEKWFIDEGKKYRIHWSSDGMESEIFSFLTSRELIDCYRTMHPESNGFTWQRDNSTAKSRIDAIWMSKKWGGKMESCYVDNLKLITEKERGRRYGVSINSMEKTWKTLKNIMIEGADHAIPKKRKKKHNKKINRNVAENMKKVKKQNTCEDLIAALRNANLDFQSVARAEKKKEILKQIQEAVKRRWENLKENSKRMINSILDRQRKSIVMDCIINENEEGNIKIITDSTEIKEVYLPLLREVNTKELIQTINTLPNNKVPGQFNLQYEWFKYLPLNGIETLKDILNMSIKLNDISRD